MTTTTKRGRDLKHMLIARRRELEDDLQGRIRSGRADRTHPVGDELEQSDDSSQGEIEVALLEMRAETVVRIDAALGRLQAGQYGSCVDCDGDIAAPRLRALPFAVRCRACEETREAGQGFERRLAQRRGGLSTFLQVSL